MISNLLAITSTKVMEMVKNQVVELIVEDPRMLMLPVMPMVATAKIILKLTIK